MISDFSMLIIADLYVAYVLHFRCRLIYAAFITGLLNNIGTHVDPIILIQKIREGLEIPGLRNSLVQILHDYYLQVS